MAVANLISYIANNKITVHVTLLIVQFLTAVITLTTQAILKDGANKLVFGCYCLLLSAAVLALIAFLSERGLNLKLTWDLVLSLLFLGFTIFVLQILGLVGLSNTSASFVSAMHPLSSVATATFSALFGVETLRWWRYDGQTKIAGILICTAGAIFMSLYTGPCVIGNTCANSSLSPSPVQTTRQTNFQLGALCIILSAIITGGLATFMARLLTKCPAPATILGITFMVGASVSGTVGYFTVDKSEWLLKGNLVPLVLLISVISLSVFPVLLLWSVMKLGPTIVTCYQPANTIITAVLSVIFLGTNIFLGTIIGALIILIGLFLVSWAQEEYLRLSAIKGDLEDQLLPVKDGQNDDQ